jgi:hypothetical protein
MRMLAGAILFLGAVMLSAVIRLASYRHDRPSLESEVDIYLLWSAYLIGAFALLMVISGLIREYRHPPRDRPEQN